MGISSRTPEGNTNCCPVCGKKVLITPSKSTGDAPCPSCGSLLWFVVREDEVLFVKPKSSNRPAPEDDREIRELVSGVEVEITAGPFQGFDGTVLNGIEEKGHVTVGVTIFGKQTPIDVEPGHARPV